MNIVCLYYNMNLNENYEYQKRYISKIVVQHLFEDHVCKNKFKKMCNEAKF